MILSEGGPNVSRSNVRTLAAVTAVAALALVAGCSLLPFGKSTPPPAPAPIGSANASATPGATSTPVVSKTSSGTAVPVPGLPKLGTKISSDIDGVELRDLQRHGALIVDVRSAADFEKEHIRGAVNVPLPDFTVTAWNWSRSRAVVVYDKTGAQGQAAQSWLDRNKFTNIYHLFRGMDGYDDTLVGNDPTPIPPKKPVLYYFYLDPADDRLQLAGTDITFQQDALKTANDFAKQLRDEFGDQYDYITYDVRTPEGLLRFVEFQGSELPMFRLVDENGRAEQFTGLGTLETVRSHLKRAIDGYRAETQP